MCVAIPAVGLSFGEGPWGIKVSFGQGLLVMELGGISRNVRFLDCGFRKNHSTEFIMKSHEFSFVGCL